MEKKQYIYYSTERRCIKCNLILVQGMNTGADSRYCKWCQ